MCDYFDDVEQLRGCGSANNESLGELVWAFFERWAWKHDYNNSVVSVRTGGFLTKSQKEWTRRVANERHLVCIEVWPVFSPPFAGSLARRACLPRPLCPRRLTMKCRQAQTLPLRKCCSQSLSVLGVATWRGLLQMLRELGPGVQDPFELTHDLGCTVDRQTTGVLHKEFERAACLLRDLPSPLEKLLEPYRAGKTE